MNNPATPEQTAKRFLASAVRMQQFMDGVVVPACLKAHPQPSQNINDVLNLYMRVLAWMRTVRKLNEPGDVQAMAAAVRALFELSVDLTLVVTDETHTALPKMRAFEHRLLFKKVRAGRLYLEKARKSGATARELEYAEHMAPEAYLRREQSKVESEKALFWPKNEPPRWTGQDLGSDVRQIDTRDPHLRMEHYYEVWYRQACWLVHGSTLTGVRFMGIDDAWNNITLLSWQSCRFAYVASWATAMMLGVMQTPGVAQAFNDIQSEVEKAGNWPAPSDPSVDPGPAP
jgi:hypothetical protein